VEHPVQPEHTQLLVELILVPFIGRDLYDRRDLHWRVGTSGEVMPGMEATGLNNWHGDLVLGRSGTRTGSGA
jgi:hypothetical protein